jgi:uncharacterized repeat protein (TIGR02543 family)
LTTNPTTGGGTVTGGGSSASGAKAVIEATPSTCYKFVDWTNANGTQLSTKSKDTITMTKDSTLRANFERITYTVSLSSGAGGSATKTPTTSPVNCGDSVTFIATSNSCYKFTGWTGTQTSTSNPLKIAINVNTALTANFELKQFDLSVNATTGGSATGSGEFACNSARTLTAIADSCYIFKNWSAGANVISTDNPLTITLTQDTTLTANFEIKQFDLVVNATTGGSVTPNGTSKRSCNSVISINAIPDSCHIFKNWVDKNNNVVSIVNPLPVTITKDTLLTANFELKQFDLMLDKNPTNGGNVTGAGNYNCGSSVTITATANTNYMFLYWTDGIGSFFSSNATEIVRINSNKHYIAHFIITLPDQYVVNLNSNPIGAILTGTGGYKENTNATIYADFQNDCYKFKNWTANGIIVSTSNPLTIKVTQDTTLTANFELKKFNLTLDKNSTNGGTVTGAGTYNCRNSVTITATANTDYKFVNWTSGSNVISTSNPLPVTIIRDTLLTANFDFEEIEIIPEEFIVQLGGVNPVNAGKVIGIGSYKLNDTAILTAVADSGYQFSNWTSADVVISEENPLKIVITQDTVITANFVELENRITNAIKLGAVSITPNPTTDDFTITFEVMKSDNIRIVLTDLLGEEISEIYYGFVPDGLFTRIVKTTNFVRGVYFVKIFTGENQITKKVIVE